MKRILAITICVTTLFSLFALQANADLPDTGISINVYNWGEYISVGEDGLMDVNEEFYKRTGIKVNYTCFETNEGMYTKLKNGGVNYDVVIPSDYMISRMIGEDMLEELDFSNIPNLQLIDERFRTAPEYDPTGKHSVPYTWGQVGILYNKKYVTESVDSWSILWNTEYKGKILMIDNPRDAFGIAQKRLGYSFNSTDENEWRNAAEMLKAQAEVKPTYVMDQIFDKLSSEDAYLAPYYSGDALTLYDLNNDISFAVPKEGNNLFVDAMCIPKGSKNKEAAEAYINFLCETDVATDNISYISYSSPQTQAAAAHKAYLAEEYGDWATEIAYPSSIENTETFKSQPDEISAKMDELWVEVKNSNGSGNTAVFFVIAAVVIGIGAYFFFTLKKKRAQNYD